MNPVLLYNIIDLKGNIIFKFPPNTLLEKITDVWPLIIDYYENYYPFAVGNPDQNYRKVTPEESKTNDFIKLFYAIYKDDRIKMINHVCNGSKCIAINDNVLIVKGGINKFSSIVSVINKSETSIEFNNKLDNIECIYLKQIYY